MPNPSRRERRVRRAVALTAGWIFAAALYLLLIDLTTEPELIVGAGITLLAAGGLELAREQGVVGEGLRLRWLVKLHRPLLKVPADIFFVSAVAIRQLVHREPARGTFRAVPFRSLDDERLDRGRCALSESAGSFAPNTTIIGVDHERQLILAHQLHRTGGREAIDLLELG